MNNKYNVWIFVVVLGVVIFAIYHAQVPEQFPPLNAENNHIINTKIAQPKMGTRLDTSFNAADLIKPSSPTNKKDYSQIQSRLEAMHARRSEQSFNEAEVEAAIKRPNAWAPSKETPQHLPLKSEELTDGREFIQLDTLKIETLMPDDKLQVSIRDTNRNYEVIIDRVEKQDYNTVTWFGHINGDDGQSYSVSFSRGLQLTVGGIDTPDGHYVLQAHGNDGWIASSGLLFKADERETDAVEIPK